MKGDDHKQGSSPCDLSLKRKTPDDGLSSSNRLQEESQHNDCSLEMNGSHRQRDTTWNPGRVIIILETALGGDVPQVDEPWIRTRLISEVRNAMGLQGRDGTIQYHLEEEDDGENEMHLDIDNMSYGELLAIGECIGHVSTGYSEEVLMAKMVQRKFSFSTTVPRVDAEASCICQEEYAEDDEVGKLECGHEYPVGCIKEWLAQKNWCPICKNTALAT